MKASVWGLVGLGVLAGSASAEQYAYDGLGRLVLVVADNGTQTMYSYDAAGNRTQVATAAGANARPTATDLGGVASTSSITLSPSFSGGSLTSVSSPQFGSASASGASIVYVPAPSHPTGSDIFTYTVTSGSGLTASATVKIGLQ